MFLCIVSRHGSEDTTVGYSTIVKANNLFQHMAQYKDSWLAFCLIIWSKGRERIWNHKENTILIFEHSS